MSDSDETHEAQLRRIETLTLTARATWFGYLAALAFAGVTLLGIEDKDFFSADSSTQLPLINVSVPVTSFFAAGAPLIALIFGYLHVFLEKLWAELANVKRPAGDRTLSSEIQPWLISDFALHVRRNLRDEHQRPPIKRTALGLLGTGVTFTMGWIGGPLVMFGFWYVSMPAHMLGLTIWLGILFAITLWTACVSLAALRRNMLEEPEGTPWHQSVQLMAVVCLSLPIILVSDLRTRTDLWDDLKRPDDYTSFLSHPKHWFRPVPAELSQVALTELPSDYLNRSAAQEVFFLSWCKSKDPHVCSEGIPLNLESQFQTTWKDRRSMYIQSLKKPIRRGFDFVGADLGESYLVGIDFEGANLSKADLSSAQLEAANLRGASIVGANLSEARLQGAILSGASLQETKLTSVQMQGANLRGAKFQDPSGEIEAELWTLQEAQSWEEPKSGETNQQLFERHSKERDQLWARISERYENRAARLHSAQMQLADLREAQLRWVDLSDSQLQGADLRRVQMHDAILRRSNLSHANMRNANLTRATLDFSRILGEKGNHVSLKGTKLYDSQNMGGAIRFANLTKAQFADDKIFQDTFADATVYMPSDFAKPCQWAGGELSDEAFWGHWRGWLSAGDYSAEWARVAPAGFEDVTPIPPPDGCEWKTGSLNRE